MGICASSLRQVVPIVDTQTAKEKARIGDLDGAIALSQAIVDDQFDTGEMICGGPAVSVLVESLLRRGAAGEVQTAREVIDRLAAVPTDPGFVLHEIPLLRLRALVARQGGDQTGYHDWVDRYRAKATACGCQGHMATAEAMRCP
jgi:adenylate cyclase